MLLHTFLVDSSNSPALLKRVAYMHCPGGLYNAASLQMPESDGSYHRDPGLQGIT